MKARHLERAVPVEEWATPEELDRYVRLEVFFQYGEAIPSNVLHETAGATDSINPAQAEWRAEPLDIDSQAAPNSDVLERLGRAGPFTLDKSMLGGPDDLG